MKQMLHFSRPRIPLIITLLFLITLIVPTALAYGPEKADQPVSSDSNISVALYDNDDDDGDDDDDEGDDRTGVRFATFNASLNRNNQGDLVAELSEPGSGQPDTIAEIIQRTRPDVLLINEFDFDEDGAAARLFRRTISR